MEATMKEFFAIATLTVAAATFVNFLAEVKDGHTETPVSIDRSAEVFHPIRGIEAHTASTSVPSYTLTETIIVAPRKAKHLVCAAPMSLQFEGHEGQTSFGRTHGAGQTVKTCEWK